MWICFPYHKWTSVEYYYDLDYQYEQMKVKSFKELFFIETYNCLEKKFNYPYFSYLISLLTFKDIY